jgi:hypothetical protein
MKQSIRESDLEIQLTNGSIIKLHGPESLRGAGLDFVVLDEYADMPPELWEEVVWPMLADRQGRALFLGTPQGRQNHFYETYLAAQHRPNWAAFRFRTEQGGYIPRDELALLRSQMDARHFAQELDASFEDLQGRVYHAFSPELNVREIVAHPNVNLLIGMDFNIDPMTAVIAQRAGNECQVWDEVVLRNSNTQEMMQEINRRYAGRTGVVHPDPSGNARKTSAPVGQTDFTIIRQAGWPVYKMEQYPVVDRVNTVNAMLCDANGVRRLFIHPRCQQLIRSLDGLTYKQGSHLPDKTTGLDHASDALGYLIMAAFSMIRHESRTVEVLF